MDWYNSAVYREWRNIWIPAMKVVITYWIFKKPDVIPQQEHSCL